eukprot:CAMPEP_0118659272 /NCGR_PEP_ID=MMETSP0785-20121206/15021_1 /TAXON_ID=91992 /ORGANISM="Bolidomonas pacifica, Strain CCMP 1866" /LENGTH=141 /DNA_ID=CAMNT_0006552361 /DNA_START=200 /DNA_END=621 /DNA_ORIENTATION=-
MSPTDIRNVADVRRSIWTGGFTGLAFGLPCGFIAHRGLFFVGKSMGVAVKDMRGGAENAGLFDEPVTSVKDFVRRSIRAAAPLSKNHRMMFVFGGGALMSYVGASAAGKNNRYKMEDVYERGKLDTLKLYEKMNEEKKEAA